jgi:hypothetical protein
MIDKNKTLEQEQQKTVKIEFAPGCFDQFDGTQEELDQMIADIRAMVENGTLDEHAQIVTEDNFDELPEEIQIQLARALLDPEDQHLIPHDRKLQ